MKQEIICQLPYNSRIKPPICTFYFMYKTVKNQHEQKNIQMNPDEITILNEKKEEDFQLTGTH